MTKTIKIILAKEYATQRSGFVRQRLEATLRERQGSFQVFIERTPLTRSELVRIGAMWQHETKRDKSWGRLTLEERLRFITETEAIQLERSLVSDQHHQNNVPYDCGDLIRNANKENPGRVSVISEPHDARVFELDDDIMNAASLLMEDPSRPEAQYLAMLVVLNYCEASFVRSVQSVELIDREIPEDGFGLVIRNPLELVLVHMLRKEFGGLGVEGTRFQHPILGAIKEVIEKGDPQAVDFEPHAQAYLEFIKRQADTPRVIWQGMLSSCGYEREARLVELAPGFAVIQDKDRDVDLSEK